MRCGPLAISLYIATQPSVPILDGAIAVYRITEFIESSLSDRIEPVFAYGIVHIVVFIRYNEGDGRKLGKVCYRLKSGERLICVGGQLIGSTPWN